jgi:O-antigen/teichoic acid export membrane protein
MNKHRIVLIGSALSVVSMGATVAVGFFLMPFLVHRLGDRMYGYWTLVGALLGYYGVLDLGITPAVSFQIAKAIGEENGDSPNRVLSTAVVAFTILGGIILVLTGIVAAICPHFIASASDARIFRAVLLIMGVSWAVGFPGRAILGAVGAHLRSDLGSWVTIGTLAVRTGLTVWVILAGDGLVALALVSLLSSAATFLANYLILRRIQKGLRISLALAEKRIFRELFRYGRYTVITQVGDQLRFAVDSWMVVAFVGIAAVAHYAIASRLSNYFLTLILSAAGVLVPVYSQLLGGKNDRGIRTLLSLGTRVTAGLSTIIVGSFALYGRAFIGAWMGARYEDAYWPSLILIAAMFCDLAQYPSVSYLQGVFKHRYLAYQTIAEGVANLGLSIYWARSYGMIGVAMGTLVPMFIAKIILQPAYVCRAAGVPLAKYYIRDFGGGIAAPALCCVGMWALVFRRMELSNLWVVCTVVALQGVICAVAAFYLVVGAQDRQSLLAKVWPKRGLAGQAATSARVSLDLREPALKVAEKD